VELQAKDLVIKDVYWRDVTARPCCIQEAYCTRICSGSEEGSYLRLIDFVYHSALGLRVIWNKKEEKTARPRHALKQPFFFFLITLKLRVE